MLAYLKLLFKDRLLSFSPKGMQKAGQSKAKSIATQIGFILLALLLYGMVVALEYFLFQGFVMIQNPEGILAVVFLFSILVTLFMSFFYVFQTLFFTKDITFVSALPISSRSLMGVKLFMVLLGEAGIALVSCLPAMILYGIHTGEGLWLYVKMLLFVPFLPMIPIAVVTLIAFCLIRISALWKRREGMTTIASFVVVVGAIALQMNMSTFGQQEGSEQVLIQFLLKHLGIVDVIASYFPPIRWVCNVFLAQGMQGWLSGLLLAIVSVAMIALVVYGLGSGYQALAVKQSEAVARLNAQAKKKKGIYGTRSPLAALYLRELKEIFVVPAYATNCLATLVMFPIMVVIMILSMEQSMSGIPEMEQLVGLVSPSVYLAIVSAVIALTCSMNIAVSTAVSREGKRHYFSQIIPVVPGTQLQAKLLMGMTLNAISSLTTAIVLWFFLPWFWLQTLIGFLLATLYSLLTCELGLILDVYRPNFEWKSEVEAVKRNVNGVLSMFGSLLILGLLVGLFFLLASFGMSVEWGIFTIAAVMIGLDALLIGWMKGKAASRYSLQ